LKKSIKWIKGAYGIVCQVGVTIITVVPAKSYPLIYIHTHTHA
jgi:hypothetical protein